MLKVALLISRFNEEICSGLKQGAVDYLKTKGIEIQEIDIFSAPGAFEIPLLAQNLAQCGRYSGVVCLGCVIKGDTAHFEFISLGTTYGLMQSMLATQVPITFGVLTTYTDEQALVRSQPNAHNKGKEAAAACLEAIETLARIKSIKE